MKRLSLLFLLFFAQILSAQINPDNFLLGDEMLTYKSVLSPAPASNSIGSIITIGDTVWIGTSRGVSFSTDRGETWTNFYGIEAFGTESIFAIGYDDGVFWAATGHAFESGGQSLPEGSGLRYTTDNGNTWVVVNQPVDLDSDSTIVYGINDGVQSPKVRALPVTTTVQNVSYDIAFTPGTIWVASFAAGLRKSTDMGQTWQRVLLPSDKVNSISPDDTIKFSLQPVSGKFGPEDYLNHRVFSVIAADDSTLYVGTAGGINKSTDNGISWQKFSNQNQTKPISGNFVVGLGYNQITQTIWGATWRAEGETEYYAVSASTNAGESWNTFLTGERTNNFGFKDEDVIAVNDNGVYRSSNGGTSWIQPGTITDNITGITLRTNAFYSAASQGDIVWLGSSDGLVRIKETGTWQGEWKVYIASQPLSSRAETYAYPNPFSPRLDNLKIKYTTSGEQKSVTIRIFDFDMNYVTTVIQNALRGNPTNVVDELNTTNSGVIDFWDGRDDDANLVPNGVYFYRIDVSGLEPVYGKILVLQ
jgi:ligand-binding sensor domain-containing protein